MVSWPCLICIRAIYATLKLSRLHIGRRRNQNENPLYIYTIVARVIASFIHSFDGKRASATHCQHLCALCLRTNLDRYVGSSWASITFLSHLSIHFRIGGVVSNHLTFFQPMNITVNADMIESRNIHFTPILCPKIADFLKK